MSPEVASAAMTEDFSGDDWAARAYGVSKVFGEGDATVTALDDVSVGFRSGEFTAVMGPSGSGKSTLIQCMAGLDHITSGVIFVGDNEIQHLDPTALTLLRREQMGFVFQAYNLVPSLTARQNIVLPEKLAKRPVDQGVFDSVIDMLKIRDRLGHRPAELSGGQQQRVALARALVARPRLLFADEPTGNLDRRTGAEVLGFLRRSTDVDAQTVVMVTHDPIAAAVADRVIFLADGRIVHELDRPSRDDVIAVLAGAT